MKGVELRNLVVHKDNRGWLAEIFRPEYTDKKINGQVMMTTAYPGIIKANHYHKRKHEWYCVIQGTMILALKDMKTGKKEEITLSDKELKIVKISPNVAHGFKNTGDGMLFVLMYIDEPFDANDPDTFLEAVIE